MAKKRSIISSLLIEVTDTGMEFTFTGHWSRAQLDRMYRKALRESKRLKVQAGRKADAKRRAEEAKRAKEETNPETKEVNDESAE